MRPIRADPVSLDELATRLARAARRAEASSTDVELAASAVACGVLPDAGRAVGWAMRLRDQLLRAVLSLSAVALVVARGYRQAEDDVVAGFVALERPFAGASCHLGDASAAAGLAPDDVSATWWAPVERLLTELPPQLLEGLLVGAPALARLVVEAPLAPPGSAAGALSAVLRRAALLGPAPAADLVARHLAAMPADVRRRMALLHPRLMTAAAGAPTSDRFAASRVLVAADLATLEAGRPSAPPEVRRRLDRRARWEQRLLHEQVELRHRDGTVTRHPHQLLLFDPAGDGRIVEVLGDLDRARHVAVFVPGTGSDLDRYVGTVARMTPFAEADAELAVVVWQGADHPDQPFDDGLPSVIDVARSAVTDPDQVPRHVRSWPREHVLAAGLRDSADVAGPALARDVAGLRAAAPGPTSDLTVLGHSYGGSIVGAAELHGLVADRVVHVASAGAYVHDLDDLPESAAHARRFSMTAFDDPIRLSQGHDMRDAGPRLRQLLPVVAEPLTMGLPRLAAEEWGPAAQVGHGLDPDLLPGVVRLDTGVHDDGTLVRGHSGMFAPDSTAWRNLLGVMTRGTVEVLEPQRWGSHLEPLQVPTVRQEPGHPTVPGHAPRYVVDRSPYGDPRYQPPVLDLGGSP